MKQMEARILAELRVAETLVARRKAGEQIRDFDIRGNLYDMALELAPDARAEEFPLFHGWIRPESGMSVLDFAAGTGFHTLPLAKRTQGVTVALDPSRDQLAALQTHAKEQGLAVSTILGSPDQPELATRIGQTFDRIVSYGGLHHVDDQRAMMENVAKLLKTGGRLIVGDVGAGTSLAQHFDTFVTEKCLTSHSAQWLSPKRLEMLIDGTGLRVVRTEQVNLDWKFKSPREMTLFFQGLHAYDLSHEEIYADLRQALGVVEKDGLFCLHWPMFFFEIEKA